MKDRSDNFVHVPASPRNIDRWIARTSILNALNSALPRLHGAVLDVGCGRKPYRELILSSPSVTSYLGLDVEGALVYDPGIRPDAVWDGVVLPFGDQCFDCAVATEVFEHVCDIGTTLREIHRVLRPGGLLFFTTPFLWPYHETPHDYQRFTSFAVGHHLQSAGFRDIDIKLEGNWHSSLAQMLGLWGGRAAMPRLLRGALRLPIFATQRLLMRHATPSKATNGSMPHMLYGTALA